MSLNVCIVGAAGRMGKNVASAVYADPEAEVSGAVDKNGGDAVGVPVYEWAGCGKGGPVISGDLRRAARNADVVIDFTGAAITSSNVPLYGEIKVPLVVGSTGFTDEQKRAVKSLSEKTALLMAPNMSLGVNVVLKLVEFAARSLKGYDIEISEIHHRMKKDAPSGTALALAEAAAEAAGLNLDENAVYCRHGMTGERGNGEIGVQALRGGDVTGDHTVFFFGNGERVEITHRAHSRSTFAEGALAAARWIKGKKPGLYSMDDVLF